MKSESEKAQWQKFIITKWQKTSESALLRLNNATTEITNTHAGDKRCISGRTIELRCHRKKRNIQVVQ